MDLSHKTEATRAAQEAARAAQEALDTAALIARDKAKKESIDAMAAHDAFMKESAMRESAMKESAMRDSAMKEAEAAQVIKVTQVVRAADVTAAAVRLEQEEDDCQEVYLNEAVFANKSNNHTIEHVYSLDDENLRAIHWKECVLSKSDCDNPEMIKACVRAEQNDCLSTVFLCSSIKDWGTTTTEAQLQAYKEGQSGQVMDDYYIWQQQAEEDHLRSMLWTRDIKKDDLQVVLATAPYYNEATRRLKGVESVLVAIPDQDKARIMENDLCFALILDKLRSFCKDPREDLMKKVALFHWALKSLPLSSRRIAMV